MSRTMDYLQIQGGPNKVVTRTHDHNSVKTEPIKKISLENFLLNL